MLAVGELLPSKTTTATFSTGAELYAAACCTIANYLRSVLVKLAFPHDGPASVHEDKKRKKKLHNDYKTRGRNLSSRALRF